MPANDRPTVNGALQSPTVYKIGVANYFKLRDLGKALGFCVGWTREDGVFIDTGKPYSD